MKGVLSLACKEHKCIWYAKAHHLVSILTQRRREHIKIVVVTFTGKKLLLYLNIKDLAHRTFRELCRYMRKKKNHVCQKTTIERMRSWLRTAVFWPTGTIKSAIAFLHSTKAEFSNKVMIFVIVSSIDVQDDHCSLEVLSLPRINKRSRSCPECLTSVRQIGKQGK